MSHNPSTSFEMLRLNPGLPSDPSSGRAGEIYYNNTLNTLRYFDGSLWLDFGGIWANQNLSNLLTTAINQDLNPDTTLTRNLGTSLLVWQSASVQSLQQVATISDVYSFGIQVSSQNALSSDNSGALSMSTGSSVNGATGGILIRTGSPSGGTTVFKQQNSSFAATAFNFDTTSIGTKLAGVQLIAPSNGVLSSIAFKLQNATVTSDTYSAQLFVYSDSSGTPGTVITSSAIQSIPIAGSTSLDYTFTFQAPVNVVNGQTYYFILAAQSFASTLNLLGSASSVSADNFTSSTNSGTSWTTTAFPDPYYILYNSPTRGTIDIDGGVARLMNQSALRFMNPSSTNYVAFKAPTTIPSNVTWTLPNADGTLNQSIVTDGSGNLSWATVGITDFSDSIFRIHDNGDITKKLAFEVSGIATGTLRTWTVPDANINFALGGGTFVYRAGDTMTGTLNLPLNGLNVNSGQFRTLSATSMENAGVMHIIDQPSTVFPGYISFTHAAGAGGQAYVGIDDVGLLNQSPGNLILGSSTSVAVSTNGSVKMLFGTSQNTTSQTIIPSADNTIDTGSFTRRWANEYSTNFISGVSSQYLVLSGSAAPTKPSGSPGGGSLYKPFQGGGSGSLLAVFTDSNADNTNPSGTLFLESGNNSGTAGTGGIRLRTGVPASGARGQITLLDGSEGTTGHVWTSTDTTGEGHWAAIPTPTGLANTSAYFNASGVLSSNTGAQFFASFNSRADVVDFGGGIFSANAEGAYIHGIAATSGTLHAGGRGSLSQGEASNSGNLVSAASGSIAAGGAYGGTISAGNNGSFAHGEADNGASIGAGGLGAEAAGNAGTGGNITASGSGAKAFGFITNGTISAGGIGSIAHGNSPNTFGIDASGDGAYAGGDALIGAIQASGSGAFAHGDLISVSAVYGSALGLGHANSSYASTAIGRYSDDAGTAGSWVTTDPLFVVGIGTGTGARANSFKIQKDGKLFILDPSLSTALVGYNWTLQNATTGEGAWVAATGGANTSLSNLITTAINQDLIWAFTGGATKTLRTAANGGASITGDNLLLKSGDTGGNNSPSGNASLKSGDAGNANSGTVLIASGTVLTNSSSSGAINIATGNNGGAAGPGASGSVSISTGTVGGTQTSGNISLITGTGGSTRGSIRFQESTLGTAVNGYLWTLADQTTGRGGWALAPAVSPSVEYRTISSGEATANQLTLTGTPATPSKTLVDIFDGGGPMQYTAEFTVSGTTLSWSGGVYAGVLVAGNRLRVTYWT